MGNSLIVINENNMSRVIQDLSTHIDNIKKVSKAMSDEVHSSSTYFKGEIAENFRNKFVEFEDTFKVIISNIESYKTDIENVKNKFVEHDQSVQLSEIEFLEIEGGGDLSGINET